MRLGLFVVLLSSGCATQQAEKMSWAEAMKSAIAAPAPKPKRKPDARLDALLRAFIEASQVARKAAPSGAAMPASQSAAWVQLLSDVDAYVARPITKTSAFDLVRARVVVESELEFDAQAYGDIGPATAAAAQATVARLSSRLDEVMAQGHKKKVSPQQFAWPVSPVQVTSPFGDRVHPLTGTWRLHRGTDILAELGQPVRAAFSGTVLFAGWYGAHGKTVHLWHDSHWTTRYSHLSGWQVTSGDWVEKGQIIGYAGATGAATGPHVHFELLHEGEPVDAEGELPPPGASQPMAAR